MLGRWRFSISGLMAGVALAAVGLWAFRTGTEAAFRIFYTVMVGVLLVATLAAWLGPERRRGFWIGFALFGWASLLLGFGLKPGTFPFGMGRVSPPPVNEFLLSTPWLHRAHRLLKPPQHIRELDAYPYAPPIGHLLMTLALAALGGGLALVFPGSRQDSNAPALEVPRAAAPRNRLRARVVWGAAGTVLLLLLVVLLARRYSAVPPGPYFPDLVFSPVKRKHEARAGWYGKHLEAMGEPSLWRLAESGRGEEVFRLLWIPIQGRPATVRITKSGESLTLTTVVIDNHNGEEPGSVAIRTEEALDPGEWEQFLELVDNANFWDFTTTPQPVEEPWDRRQLHAIIEAVSPGRYHVVDRSVLPNDGMFEVLCKRLRELGEIDGDGNMTGYMIAQ
jgi:hypothetical protein